MKRINSELEFREHLQQHSIGAYNDNRLMPLKDIHPDSVTDHVNSGLLHPWLGVLINRRRCLSSKAEDLKHQLGASCKEILVCRQNSNFEYVEIRRRLTTFLTDFTEDFLLPYCPQDNNNNYTEMIEKNFKLQTIHRWIEATANLGNWLTEPKRYHMFADIITPFLYGLFYVSVSSMIKSLVTNLLPNAYTDDNKNNAIGVLSSSSSSPANQRSSRPMLLAMELASPESRRIIQQLVNSVNNSMLLGNLKNNDDTLRKTQEIQFRISSFILNLLWLHNAEKNTSTLPFENMHKLIGRILNSMLRPLAQHWRHIEAERKRLSELRAALFLEADRRKQLIRNELQGIKTDAKGGQQRRQHHQQQSDRCTSPELIDQSLNEELDWRLRFSESACLKAFSELSIGANKLSASGLAKEDQIQQTVNKLEAVDNWLKKSLNTSDKYWIPDENELVYFINRLVYLLLLCCSNSETPSSTSINNPMIHSKSEMPIHQLDVTNAFSWHWHTVLFGYNLATYMGQYDIRAHPILPIIGSSPSSSSSSNSTSPSNYHFNSKWLIMKSHCYNVYLDPIPLEEAEKLNSILKHLESQVKHILNQWPGQPSLLRVSFHYLIRYRNVCMCVCLSVCLKSNGRILVLPSIHCQVSILGGCTPHPCLVTDGKFGKEGRMGLA
ncbi:unnamed protein product [Trichobilharzia regenti]|nr:unnamed protein product [Trichobilharzia regenti]